LDDVGASSKRYEVSRIRIRVFGKRLVPRNLWGWAPYREMHADEWRQVFDVLQGASARMTVAVTAAWADRSDRVTPFPVMFPRQAEALKDGVRLGRIEIANHGLTHCVLEGNRFRPRWMSSNRVYHREFWEWVPLAVHEQHLRRSQDILQEYFGVPVVTFVPPGNVFTQGTLDAAERCGLRYMSCQTEPQQVGKLRVIGNKDVLPFHDRDLVTNGVGWLQSLIERQGDARCCAVADLM
jgi:hypothetical protein